MINNDFIVSSRTYPFSDLHWTLTHGKPSLVKTPYEMKQFLMHHSDVKHVINELIVEEMSKGLSERKAKRKVEAEAKEIITRMQSRMNHKTVQFFSWFLHKVWRSIYEQIVVNSKAIDGLKKLVEGNKGNIILCPTHRSYVDFLIVSYIMFQFKMEVPHICAGEDFLNIKLVHHLLRRSGAFFMRRSFKGDPLYKVIFNTYVTKLLGDGSAFEFFVEGTRSRTGKMLKPKFGLLGVLMDNFYDKKVNNLQFVPVTINYSRVLECESYPGELLGEPKVKESMGRILNAMNILKMNFGTINVEFDEPIDFNEYQKAIVSEQGLNPTEVRADRKTVVEKLGYDLVFILSRKLIIQPTAICATILLHQR